MHHIITSGKPSQRYKKECVIFYPKNKLIFATRSRHIQYFTVVHNIEGNKPNKR